MSKIGMDKPNLPTILDLENLSRLDKRIFPSYLDEFSSVFNFSRYILNELIVAPGPLIDEY